MQLNSSFPLIRFRHASFLLMVILAMALTLPSCQKETTSEPTPPAVVTPAKEIKDVSYGSNALQKFDIYLPANRTAASTKLVIMIHGGGWNTGDKTDFNSDIPTIRAKWPEVAIVNMNYRLAVSNATRHPVQLEDIRLLIDFIKSKTGEYMVSNNFGMLGASAGAHLSLLYAYAYDTARNIKAVASLFAPTNFTDNYYTGNAIAGSLIENYLGKPYLQDSVLWRKASPLYNVTASAVPTALYQGGVDLLVPVNQATALKARLDQLGVINQYTFYATEGHGWTGANLDDTINKMIAFFKLYL
jgi:acetyl esterase/lipase